MSPRRPATATIAAAARPAATPPFAPQPIASSTMAAAWWPLKTFDSTSGSIEEDRRARLIPARAGRSTPAPASGSSRSTAAPIAARAPR